MAGGTLATILACNGVLGIPEVERRPLATAADGAPCAPGQKTCSGLCVSMGDPAIGCAATSCQPCALAHAKNACVDGECAIETCEEGFGNCNGDRADGCEINLRADPKNCRECRNDCGNFRCEVGACVCTTDESCRFNGVCDTKSQVCACGGTSCPVGVDCSDVDTCSF